MPRLRTPERRLSILEACGGPSGSPPLDPPQVHTATVGLGEVHSCAEKILEGKVSGRVVVDVNKQ